MTSFIIVVLLGGSIAGLAAVLVLSQRQFDGTDDRPTAAPRSSGSRRATAASGPPPIPPPEFASSSLSTLVAHTIEVAARTRPRNMAEADAVKALRLALARAVDGEFGARIRELIDTLDGIEALHDVRRSPLGDDLLDDLILGPEIDHLVVGPSGVTVVDAKVRSAKVSYDGRDVYVGRGIDRSRDTMVDDVVREMAAVTDVVGPIPVRGVIVLADMLSLPDEIRSEAIEVGGVRLVTPEGLGPILTEPGPVVDRAIVAARLRTAFEPAIRHEADDLRLGDRALISGPTPTTAPTNDRTDPAMPRPR